MKWALAFFVFAGSLRAVSIGIAPTSTTTAPGVTFTLDVTISDVVDLYAFQVDVEFNPGVLAASFVTDGDFLGSSFIPGSIDNGSGVISLMADTLSGMVPGISGSGTLARIDFLALVIGTSSIDATNAILLDSGLSEISYDVTGGSVTVSHVPEPRSAIPVLLAVGLGIWRQLARRPAG